MEKLNSKMGEMNISEKKISRISLLKALEKKTGFSCLYKGWSVERLRQLLENIESIIKIQKIWKKKYIIMKSKKNTNKGQSSQNIISYNNKITDNERSLYIKYKQKAKFDNADEEYEYSNKNEKKCSKCGVMKKLNEYRGNTSGSDPFDKSGYRLRRPECNDCNKIMLEGKNKAKKIANAMGIPYKAPEGTKCALCGKEPTKGNGLVFDHCHETNTFRGYLHNSCNRSIGVLGDNVESLLKGVNYLNNGKKIKIIQDKYTGELRIKE